MRLAREALPALAGLAAAGTMASAVAQPLDWRAPAVAGTGASAAPTAVRAMPHSTGGGGPTLSHTTSVGGPAAAPDARVAPLGCPLASEAAASSRDGRAALARPLAIGSKGRTERSVDVASVNGQRAGDASVSAGRRVVLRGTGFGAAPGQIALRLEYGAHAGGAKSVSLPLVVERWGADVVCATLPASDGLDDASGTLSVQVSANNRADVPVRFVATRAEQTLSGAQLASIAQPAAGASVRFDRDPGALRATRYQTGDGAECGFGSGLDWFDFGRLRRSFTITALDVRKSTLVDLTRQLQSVGVVGPGKQTIGSGGRKLPDAGWQGARYGVAWDAAVMEYATGGLRHAHVCQAVYSVVATVRGPKGVRAL